MIQVQKGLTGLSKYFSPLQVQLDNLHSDWSGSLQIGVTCQNPDQICLPSSSLLLKENTWVVSGDSVFYNGIKVSNLSTYVTFAVVL